MDHSSRPSRITRSIAPMLAMAALTVGCATLPKTGAQDNGQALYVDVHTENIQYVGKVKAGEVVHKDASGNVIGTSEAYEDKLMSYNITTWAAFQGEDKLDDEDFFRISGDTQAFEQIHNGRDRAVALNKVGWVMAAAGGAVAVTGLILFYSLKTTTTTNQDVFNPVTGMTTDMPVTTTEPNRTPGAVLLYPGLIVAVIGGSLAAYGNAAAKREHPLDDPRRAKRDERTYNKKNGLKPVTGEERRAKRRGGDDEE